MLAGGRKDRLPDAPDDLVVDDLDRDRAVLDERHERLAVVVTRVGKEADEVGPVVCEGERVVTGAPICTGQSQLRISRVLGGGSNAPVMTQPWKLSCRRRTRK